MKPKVTCLCGKELKLIDDFFHEQIVCKKKDKCPLCNSLNQAYKKLITKLKQEAKNDTRF